MTIPRIAITTGEPAGIGPDVTLMAACESWPVQLVAIGCRELLQRRAQRLGIALRFTEFDAGNATTPHRAGVLPILDTPLITPAIAGELNPGNATVVLKTLELAVDGCLDGLFDAMVTAPIQKSVISDSGVDFSGHTEFLAARTNTDHVVMLLSSGLLRVALATTHLPLNAVAGAITAESLSATLTVLNRDLQEKFGLETPRITVLGLNPHAGEGGHLGREEIDVIVPVLENLRRQGMQLAGPLAADTAFNGETRAITDAYLAMYHDQGLPVLKFAGFGSAVNITLGLPIIRTSVDHGTALSLAGSGQASDGSMKAAIQTAITMVGKRVAH